MYPRRQRQSAADITYFVYQYNGFPPRGDTEDTLQCVFNNSRSIAKISCSDHIERTSKVLAGCLGGQRLPNSGRAEQIDYEALALSLHKIVEIEVGVVRFRQRSQEVAPVSREH